MINILLRWLLFDNYHSSKLIFLFEELLKEIKDSYSINMPMQWKVLRD